MTVERRVADLTDNLATYTLLLFIATAIWRFSPLGSSV